jgi:hypothetical protein
MCLVLVTDARAQTSKPPAKDVNLTVSGKSAYLTFKDFEGLKVDLKAFAGAAVITDAEILFSTRSGDISYVVLTLSGPTRAVRGGGNCGAGEESNLVWVKASHTDILDVRSMRYDSCAFSISVVSDPIPTAKGVTAEYESYSEGRTYTIWYDASAPDRGLTVTSVAIERR